MKKLLLVALLTPMVAMPSTRAQRIAQQQAYMAKQEGRSGESSAPAQTAPAASAPAGSGAVTMQGLVQKFVANPQGLSNFLHDWVESNNLPAPVPGAGNADLATFNSL